MFLETEHFFMECDQDLNVTEKTKKKWTGL